MKIVFFKLFDGQRSNASKIDINSLNNIQYSIFIFHYPGGIYVADQ